MRLDPTFLVAPEPEPAEPAPRLVSRRMFAIGVLASAGLGAASGFVLSRRSPPPAPQPPVRGPSPQLLDWALRVQDGPLPQLADNHGPFLMVFADADDPRLLVGVQRLATAVIEDDPAVHESRLTLARSLTIEIEARAVARPLLRFVPALRRIR